jgi:hypothetical protein
VTTPKTQNSAAGTKPPDQVARVPACKNIQRLLLRNDLLLLEKILGNR